ncbi:proline-, glutamic acid- and leucine-rich protein 1 [Wyeomyia smithii]|uniref:proline-, glutamic acid- and leucine-rich protein 1 n=1 Tax=Wyeomyia smithii TaxID=174621 RepID=UPI002467F417|nr:proline-, glutamic acid- and leucine-rich protein 1 [Wyeomyia smithii]
MEGISKIFGGIVDVVDLNIRQTLSSLDEHQTLWNEPTHEIEAYFAKITALLGSAETRDRGLIVLGHVMCHCPPEILEERLQYWVNVCAKICNQRGQTASIPLACDVLAQLVLKSLESSDVSKLMISNIPKILDCITTVADPSNHSSTLDFLKTVMLKYPGPSGPSKNRIEQYLYSLIDSEDPVVVDRTGSCLLLLQQIKGGGQHGNLHKKTWEEYHLHLVDTIHDLLGKIFAHTPESFDVDDNLECLKLPKMIVDDEPVISAQRIATRLVNLIDYLEKAILEPYPVAKPVKPMKVLNVIFRGHAVSSRAMARNSIQDNLALGLFLPSIQTHLLKVLDALTLVLKSNMLLFGNLITDLFDQCLKTTVTVESKGRKKSFVALRMKVYESIGLWCETTSSGSGIEDVADSLLEHIIQDVTPYEPEVTLQVNASRQKLSNKAKRKLQKQQNAATNLAESHSSDPLDKSKFLHGDCGNEGLCLAALVCLSKVFEAAGCFIKPVMHKILQEKIVSICLSVLSQLNTEERMNLYCLPSSRAALLAALNALIVNPHHHCPSPLQYGVNVFNIAKIQDPNIDVRIKASELARSCELLVHPRREVFYFPIEENAVNDMLAAKKKHPLNSKNITNLADTTDQTSITFEKSNSENEQCSEDDAVVSAEKEPIARVEEVTINDEKSSPIVYELGDDENEGELQKSVAEKTSESQAIRIDSDESEVEVVNDIVLVEKQTNTKSSTSSDEEVQLVDDEQVAKSPRRQAVSTNGLAAETPVEARKRELSQANEETSAEKRPKLAECEEDVDKRVNDLVAEFVDELNEDV